MKIKKFPFASCILFLLASCILHLASSVSHAAESLCLRGAIHVHSSRSFDSQGTFAEIEKAAQKTGLDFIVLTDHVPGQEQNIWTTAPQSSDDLVWIDGVEVELDNKYHLLVLGRPATLAPWEKGKEMESVLAAKKEGALVFMGHLARAKRFKDFELINGVEIYNTHADLFEPFMDLPKILLSSLKRDKKQMWLQLLDPPKKEIKLWRQWSRTKILPVTGGNDAHQNVRLMGRQLDPYEASFGFINTYVWAEAKTEAAILRALKTGSSYVGFPILHPAQGFSFKANAKNYLKVALPPQVQGKIKIYHNGKLAKEQIGDNLVWPHPEPGLYCPEVWIQNKKRWKPWIYSSCLNVE